MPSHAVGLAMCYRASPNGGGAWNPLGRFIGSLSNPDVVPNRRLMLVEPQNVTMGLAGEPVPPRIGSGAAVKRKSQRLVCATDAARATEEGSLLPSPMD